MKNKYSQGFTMIEMLIATSIMLMVMITVLTLIISTQRTSLSESMKQQMNQEARALQQLLGDSFKSSGSVVALLNLPTFLGVNPVFNGVYPLNNSTYADGVILCAGDENVVTQTTNVFDYGEDSLAVATTNRADTTSATSGWAANDVGMLIRADGYYVFKVRTTPAVNGTALAIRDTPLYYSGLIKSPGTIHYNDSCASGDGTYNGGSFVVRLDYFYIFLARDEADNTRAFTLTTDTMGDPDFLQNSNLAVPVLFNIEDIQFSYVLKDGTVVNPNDNSAFLSKTVASVRVAVLHKTEPQKHKGITLADGISFLKPAMGDRPSTQLPVGFYNYVFNEYEIFIRNYSTIY